MNITKITPISFKGYYKPNSTIEDDLKRIEQEAEVTKQTVIPEDKTEGKLNLQNRLYYLA